MRGPECVWSVSKARDPTMEDGKNGRNGRRANTYARGEYFRKDLVESAVFRTGQTRHRQLIQDQNTPKSLGDYWLMRHFPEVAYLQPRNGQAINVT